jgi:phosphatidylserine synthase
MGDWLLNLPIPWMAVVIFAATYVIAACVYLAVVGLAVDDRARAFKGVPHPRPWRLRECIRPRPPPCRLSAS